MSDNEAADDLEEIAVEIERGEDKILVPGEMLVEPEKNAQVNQSLYAQIQNMTVGQKLKLSLRGNREARALLVRDSNRMIARFVLKNPRITDEEVASISRNRNIDSELLRLIGEQKMWARNYQVRLGLVTNPKTPLATAIHFVATLGERDMRFVAKSKNVSQTVSVQARRILAQKGRI